MTVRELSRLYYLHKLIDRDSEKLAELEAKLQPGGASIDGMPRNHNGENKIESIVPLIIELKAHIAERQEQCIREQIEIEKYIQTVEDYQIRLIISYRFIDLLSWQQVACRIGGNNTEDSVKKAFYRYIKKQGSA